MPEKITSFKQVLDYDHFPVSKFRLTIAGVRPNMKVTKVTGIDLEIPAVSLPDKTKVSGGETRAGEMTVSIMNSEIEDMEAMLNWFKQSRDPITPGYKKFGMLTMASGTGQKYLMWSLEGCWVSKYKTSDLDTNDDGNPAHTDFTVHVDDMQPSYM